MQNFHYREFGRATFITRVKSPRSFSREIECSGFNAQYALAIVTLVFNAFRIAVIGKIKVIRRVFFFLLFLRARDSG